MRPHSFAGASGEIQKVVGYSTSSVAVQRQKAGNRKIRIGKK
jgi:hypothetical protein